MIKYIQCLDLLKIIFNKNYKIYEKRKLLNNKKQQNPFTFINKSWIHYAAQNKNVNILKYIITLDNNISYEASVENYGWKAIHFAAKENLRDNIIYLQSLGADLFKNNNYFRRRTCYINKKIENKNVIAYDFLNEENKKKFQKIQMLNNIK